MWAERRGGAVTAILFDLGDTLIYERVDDSESLDRMHLELRPGAATVLPLLARRYSLGIVSDTETSSELAVRSALRSLGVERYFAAVLTSVDIGARKPSPVIFAEVLRRLGVDPSQAAMVGNDSETDISGARAMGIKTILYRNSRYYRPTADATADYEIDSLDELPALLDRLGPGESGKDR